MGKFLLGVIVTLLVLILGGLGFALLGFFPTAANVEPPHWEQHLAMSAVDASMERHAPRVTNPLMPNDDNLDRRHQALHHELRPLPRRPRPQALDPREFVLSATAKSRLRSARRSRVAHLLHDPHRRPLHRHALLGQNSDERRHVEDHHVPLSHGQTSARRPGVLEDKFRHRP